MMQMLHKIEGDSGNHRYWYRRAGKLEHFPDEPRAELVEISRRCGSSRITALRMTSGICGIEGRCLVCPFSARSVLVPWSEGDALGYDGKGPSA